MSRSFIRSTAVRAGLLAGAIGLSACSPSYTTDNSSPVIFTIFLVNGGAALQSDVLKDGVVVADTVAVEVGVRWKNQNTLGGGLAVPSAPNAVRIERYDIKYRRSDGRGVEGQDVPYSISGNVSSFLDVTTGDLRILQLEVVRAQAKLEPPLRNLRTGGGALVVTMIADITIYGKTVSGIPVSSNGALQIDFADYGS